MLKYVSPLLFLMIFCLLGCGESDDSYTTDALIMDIEVSIYSQDTSTDIQLPWELTTDWSVKQRLPTPPENSKVVIVWIDSYYGGCDGVPYLGDRNPTGSELTTTGFNEWRPGDTIEIEVWMSIYTGYDDCADFVASPRIAVFVGYCLPGTYRLRVNDIEETFTVN